MDFNNLLSYLTQKYHEWLLEQHHLHIVNARPLSSDEQLPLYKYFDKRILNSARIAVVDRISNPAFYGELIKLGISIPIDFTHSAAITLIDCILICRSFSSSPLAWLSILFHELVHVVQYNILGPEKLVELYITGWIQNGYKYENIPFEQQAYKLEGMFNRGISPFSVRQLVKQELKHGAKGQA